MNNPISELAKRLRETADAIDGDIENNPLCDTKHEIINFATEHWPTLITLITENLVKDIQEAFPDGDN